MTKLISLNQIARELKIKPKAARRKIRSLNNVPQSSHAYRWEWSPANAKLVKSALKAA